MASWQKEKKVSAFLLLFSKHQILLQDANEQVRRKSG
jgi:hypothetical protein